MHIIINKSVLLPKLAQLAKVSGNKVLGILDDILFDVHPAGLVLVSGNGEISVQSGEDRVISIKEYGKVTIPAKKLHEIVKKMGDTIEIKSNGLKVVVMSGKSKYELAGQDPEEYPEFPTRHGHPIKVKGEDFKAMVKRTAYAVSTNESTPVLQGIKLYVRGSQMTATACDRHRLAQVSYDLKEGFTDVVTVLKGLSFKEFANVIDDKEQIELTFDETRFFIKTKDYTIALKVLDGLYPVTDKLIPETFRTEVLFNVKELQGALERALVIALDDKTNILKMDIGLHETVITAESENNKAVETMEMGIVGQPLTISFNGKYMLDALNTIDSEKFRLCLNDAMQPIILDTFSTDIQLILPYRTR